MSKIWDCFLYIFLWRRQKKEVWLIVQLYATKPNARSQTSQITLQNKTLLNISPISKKEQIGDRTKRKEDSIKGRRNAVGRPKTHSQKESKIKEFTLEKIYLVWAFIVEILNLYIIPLFYPFCHSFMYLLVSHYFPVSICRYPSIKPGLRGNQSCYTSAYT